MSRQNYGQHCAHSDWRIIRLGWRNNSGVNVVASYLKESKKEKAQILSLKYRLVKKLRFLYEEVYYKEELKVSPPLDYLETLLGEICIKDLRQLAWSGNNEDFRSFWRTLVRMYDPESEYIQVKTKRHGTAK